MTWTDFYLICFAFGFVLSLLSLLGSIDLHLPHFHFHVGGNGQRIARRRCARRRDFAD